MLLFSETHLSIGVFAPAEWPNQSVGFWKGMARYQNANGNSEIDFLVSHVMRKSRLVYKKN
jgi:hypothetical protein